MTQRFAPKTAPPLPPDPLAAVAARYAVAVTDEIMATINPADPQDPLARQYLPAAAELVTAPEEDADPTGDDAHAPVKGIVHRYPDRVLLKPVHVCAVYCRFCFRRARVGPGKDTLSAPEMAAALGYIRRTPQIWEVIITGGDPFVLSPRRLRRLMAELESIDHVKVIRFHTRVPVADPGRVTRELISALKSEKAVYVALHCNHARELTQNAKAAIRLFTAAGIPLLSQSVLLRGVNDDAATLEELFRALVELRVKPYYLHHPDLAPGTGHFRLPLEDGQRLVSALQGTLSGVARPAYVLDIPGGFGKVPAGRAWVEKRNDGYIVTDAGGAQHAYPPRKK